jgi:hypothetical protein
LCCALRCCRSRSGLGLRIDLCSAGGFSLIGRRACLSRARGFGLRGLGLCLRLRRSGLLGPGRFLLRLGRLGRLRCGRLLGCSSLGLLRLRGRRCLGRCLGLLRTRRRSRAYGNRRGLSWGSVLRPLIAVPVAELP